MCKPLSSNNPIPLTLLEICRLAHKAFILKARIYFKDVS